jgi:hypothetical protein
MPHANYPLSADGMLLPVLIGLNGRATAKQAASGQPLTPPVLATALIDSASDITCIATRIVQHFGLPLLQQTRTHSIAGSVQVNLYEVSLSVLRPRPGGVLFTSEQLVVMELPQPPDAAEVLIGLDVLRQLLTMLDGPAGTFTLGD